MKQLRPQHERAMTLIVSGQVRLRTCWQQQTHFGFIWPVHAGGTAAGTKAGVVSGVRQGDTDAAAHAIANAPPEGQGASDALGQLYNEGGPPC